MTSIELSYVEWLGIIAAVLQVLGYFYYFKFIRSGHIDPNPVTWFMLAYGTALLTLLEWDTEASWAILALPAACALCTLGVAGWCWKKARELDSTRWWPKDWWPEDKNDQVSFISDAVITIGYLGCWYLAFSGALSEELKLGFVLGFLWLANISTIPAMIPLLREARQHPEKEHSTPWWVWTWAYVFLTLTTLLEEHESTSVFLALLAYPVINVVLHALVAWWATKKVIPAASH
jgi:hypothetical protein